MMTGNVDPTRSVESAPPSVVHLSHRKWPGGLGTFTQATGICSLNRQCIINSHPRTINHLGFYRAVFRLLPLALAGQCGVTRNTQGLFNGFVSVRGLALRKPLSQK